MAFRAIEVLPRSIAAQHDGADQLLVEHIAEAGEHTAAEHCNEREAARVVMAECLNSDWGDGQRGVSLSVDLIGRLPTV